MIPVFLQPLIAGGLELLANAALVKGKEWVQEKTGVDLDKPKLSSQEMMNLQQFQLEHEEELLKVKLEENKILAELEKARYADIKDARELQRKAIDSNDPFVRRFIYYLAIFWSLFAAVYIMTITLIEISPTSIRFADTILGFILGTIIAQILTFFYGSSKSSQNKDETLKEIVAKVQK